MIALLGTFFLAAIVGADFRCPVTTSLVGDRITYRWRQDGEVIHVDSTTDHFLFDLKRRKFSLQQDWSDASQNCSVWQIFDFPAHKLYTIRESHCVTSTLHEKFQVFCLPGDFTIDFWKTLLGMLKPLNEQVIPTGEYVYQDVEDRNVTTHAIWTIFGPPVLQHRFGLRDGQMVLEESFFQNLAAHEPDPSAFEPPPSCHKSGTRSSAV